MIAVLSLLVVTTLFIIGARVAAVALVGTGMASESARFQSRSALMGVGFTTSEAESVIEHPVRRRIILWLMTFGNAGVITGITGLLLGFIDTGASQAASRAAILLGGLVLLVFLSRSRVIERLLDRATRWALAKWTTLETRDLASLLRFGEDFGITELHARGDDWLVGRPLARLQLPEEGVVILGLQRTDHSFHGVPTGETVIGEGDTVIAYGRLDHLRELDDRHRGRDGDLAHDEAVQEQVDFVQDHPTPPPESLT